MAGQDAEIRNATAAAGSPPDVRTTLSEDERALFEDIADGIDRRLRTMGVVDPRGARNNVSFVIDCRRRIQERRWDRRRQRLICAALEQRHLAAGWRYASVYVMEHDHLRLRVTLRGQPSRRGAR
ncbi:MAG TPA: hypothetical protein VKA21_12925 [Candidatus Binatia bacterium]|nr:hypothetical protein [Candidatus Binatia bacterium]